MLALNASVPVGTETTGGAFPGATCFLPSATARANSQSSA